VLVRGAAGARALEPAAFQFPTERFQACHRTDGVDEMPLDALDGFEPLGGRDIQAFEYRRQDLGDAATLSLAEGASGPVHQFQAIGEAIGNARLGIGRRIV
jgi:hypothetical protein